MEITVKQPTAYKTAVFFFYLFIISGSLLVFNITDWYEYAPPEAHFSFHLAALFYTLLIVLFYFMYHCKISKYAFDKDEHTTIPKLIVYDSNASKDALDNDKKISVPIFILFCVCASALYILVIIFKQDEIAGLLDIIFTIVAFTFGYIARKAK